MSSAERRWRRRQSPPVAGRLSRRHVLDRRLLPQTALAATPRLDAPRLRQPRPRVGGGVVVVAGARRRRPETVDERRERLQGHGLVERRAAVARQVAVAGRRGRSAAVMQASSPVGASDRRQLEPERLVNACSHAHR